VHLSCGSAPSYRNHEPPYAQDVKTKLAVYLVLFVFGVIIWGAADEMRHRPEWAQFGMIAFWAGIAYVFVSALPTDRADENSGERQ
jgi:hypothetical protein